MDGIIMDNVSSMLMGVLVDTEAQDVGEKAVCNSLTEFQSMLGCGCVAIWPASVGGCDVYAVMSDRGKGDVDSQSKVSALGPDGKVAVRGSVLILGRRDEEAGSRLRSLTQEEAGAVLRTVRLMTVGPTSGDRYNVYCLTDMEVRG